LLAKTRHLDGTHLLTVLLTKQRQRPPRNGTVEVHHGKVQGRISPDLLVNQALDAIQFTLAEAGKMRKIEPQAVRRHQRPSLLDVLAQDLPQGCMQEVRGRMILADRLPAWRINVELHGHFVPHSAALDYPV